VCKKHTKKLAKSKQNYKGLRNTRNPKPVSQEPSTQTHRNTAKTDKTKTQTAKTPAATDSVANKNMRLPYTSCPNLQQITANFQGIPQPQTYVCEKSPFPAQLNTPAQLFTFDKVQVSHKSFFFLIIACSFLQQKK
jgi:hypothetical protein